MLFFFDKSFDFFQFLQKWLKHWNTFAAGRRGPHRFAVHVDRCRSMLGLCGSMQKLGRSDFGLPLGVGSRGERQRPRAPMDGGKFFYCKIERRFWKQLNSLPWKIFFTSWKKVFEKNSTPSLEKKYFIASSKTSFWKQLNPFPWKEMFYCKLEDKFFLERNILL